LAWRLLIRFPMRLAIVHWKDRVSPVFDVSDRLLLVDLDGGRELHRKDVTLERLDPFGRAKEVSSFRVEILLCGAISRVMETALIDAGVQVFSFLCGDLETILAAFLLGKLSDDRFLMPGCRGKLSSKE
jgi:predicted Fe-Mo cluster-binding NifX family protein